MITTPIPDSDIRSGNFTTGRDYLIIYSADHKSSSATNRLNWQAFTGDRDNYLVGATSLIDTDTFGIVYETMGTNHWLKHTWFIVWTATAGDDVWFSGGVNSGGSFNSDNMQIFAMEISEELTENTDWFYDTDDNTEALTTTWQTVDNAELSFTPDDDDSDWLIMAQSQIDVAGTSVNYESRITSTGTVAESFKYESSEGEDSNEFRSQHFARVYNLDNEAQTFKLESRTDTANSGNKIEQKLFALRLDAFNQHFSLFNTTGFTVTTTTNFAVGFAAITAKGLSRS